MNRWKIVLKGYFAINSTFSVFLVYLFSISTFYAWGFPNMAPRCFLSRSSSVSIILIIIFVIMELKLTHAFGMS